MHPEESHESAAEHPELLDDPTILSFTCKPNTMITNQKTGKTEHVPPFTYERKNSMFLSEQDRAHYSTPIARFTERDGKLFITTKSKSVYILRLEDVDIARNVVATATKGFSKLLGWFVRK